MDEVVVAAVAAVVVVAEAVVVVAIGEIIRVAVITIMDRMIEDAMETIDDMMETVSIVVAHHPTAIVNINCCAMYKIYSGVGNCIAMK